MFTGLIQGQGSLKSINPYQMMVQSSAPAVLEGLAVGDSVAVDGVCLTVEMIKPDGFTVTTSPETLHRSTLSQHIDSEWLANLEPALRVGDRLGGHFVTGHVDGIGQVKSVIATETSWEIQLTVPPTLARFVVSKGSIAINGVSLTIANSLDEGQTFSIAVIPHSFALTNLSVFTSGMKVNLETDILGKYIEKLMSASPLEHHPPLEINEKITPDFLVANGYS